MNASPSGVIYHACARILGTSVCTSDLKYLVVITYSKIWLGPQSFKLGHLTLTPPPPGVISHSKANTWYSLTVYKFDDFSFSRFRDMTGASSQIKDGKRPLSVVVCHPWIVTFLYMCNLNLPAKFEVSLFPPVTTIWKATQNIENGIGLGVVRGHSRSLKIAPLDRAIEFLLAFCCNSDGLVYCFWYIAR